LSNKAFKNYGPGEQQASKQLAWRTHKSMPQIRNKVLWMGESEHPIL